ncbi:MAG: BatA domain-containing protein [Candidatus Cloacimonetes bacterium]|nr:BatA domain-containing protein [Candidatus Cloacimonadota bacterium]
MPVLNFLNGALAYFALASILPLLIWLFAKKKPPQVLFSSLRFIKLSQQQEKSRTRITNIILLILRILTILLLSLAVARPAISSPKGVSGKKHPPTAIAILLDTSYSMDYMEDGSTMLQNAAKVIRQIGEKATDDDRLILITRDDAFNRLHSQIYVKEIPAESLEKLSLAWNPAPWEALITFAESRLSEAQMLNNEIYLISDLMNEELPAKSRYPLALIPLNSQYERQNISLSEARPLPQFVGRSKQQTIEFRLNNHGNTAAGEILVQAVLNDVKVAEKFFSLPPRQSRLETISFDLRSEGWQSGYIEVMDERLLADNRSYFAFEYYQNPLVGIVSASPIPHTLSSILSVYSGGKPPRLLDINSLNLQSLEDYQLLVFYDLGSLNPRSREIINTLNEKQIGSLFIPGKSITQELKSFYEQTFNIRLKGYSTQRRNIDYISPHHSITALISGKDRKYSEILGYHEASGGSPLIASGSHPLALLSEHNALWLWDLSLDSAFFVDPAFAVFAYQCAAALQNTQVPVNELMVKDQLRADAIRLPDGQILELPNARYRFSQPGLYQLNPLSENASTLAVNHLYQDSEAKSAAIPAKLKDLGADFIDKIFFARLGHELWKYLLILALLCVIAEIAIVKWQELRKPAGSSQ